PLGQIQAPRPSRTTRRRRGEESGEDGAAEKIDRVRRSPRARVHHRTGCGGNEGDNPHDTPHGVSRPGGRAIVGGGPAPHPALRRGRPPATPRPPRARRRRGRAAWRGVATVERPGGRRTTAGGGVTAPARSSGPEPAGANRGRRLRSRARISGGRGGTRLGGWSPDAALA